MSCPQCGKLAPSVTQGVTARCAVCGAPRAFLAAPSVSLAGRPTRYLGRALRMIAIVAVGTAVVGGLLLLWLAGSMFPSVAWLAWIDLAIVLTITFGAALVMRAGGRLVERGELVEAAVRTEAIRALSADRGGVTAREVARALELPEARADAELTALALAEDAAVDVDDTRGVVYRIGAPRLPPHSD